MLADAQIIKESYKDFADFIADKLPENLQTPFSYETLKKTVIDSGLYHRPLDDWDKYFKAEISSRSYTTMRQIAYTFREILKRNGGL